MNFKEKNYWPYIFYFMVIIIVLVMLCVGVDKVIIFSMIGYFIGGISSIIIESWLLKNNVNAENQKIVKRAILQLELNKTALQNMRQEWVTKDMYLLDSTYIENIELDWFEEKNKNIFLNYIHCIHFMKELRLTIESEQNMGAELVQEMLNQTNDLIGILKVKSTH